LRGVHANIAYDERFATVIPPQTIMVHATGSTKSSSQWHKTSVFGTRVARRFYPPKEGSIFQETVCGSSRLYSLTAATTLTELFDEWWKAILIGIVLAALLAARLSTLA
jgi:hypothetical protein